jgi:hypothetical protein
MQLGRAEPADGLIAEGRQVSHRLDRPWEEPAMSPIAWIGLCVAMPPLVLADDGPRFRSAAAVVEGPLGVALDQYLTRGSRFGFSGAALEVKDGTVVLKKGYGPADRSRRTPNSLLSSGASPSRPR